MQHHLEQWLKEGAIFKTPSGECLLGVGPLRWSAKPSSTQVSFYCPDFLLENKMPWICCDKVVTVSRFEKIRVTPSPFSPSPRGRGWGEGVHWRLPQKTDFLAQIKSLQPLLQQGVLQKGVPVVFAEADTNLNLQRYILSHLLTNFFCHREEPHGRRGDLLTVYGFWQDGKGMIGATPESLFIQKDPLHLETMALAGTKLAQEVWNQKEEKEHRLVVEDIQNVLSSLGVVTVGGTEEIQIPSLSHWKTPICLKGKEPISFMQAVHALHPTAALGVYPRNREGKDWLKRISQEQERERFGAPFGVSWPDGRSSVVVAIRNVQWNQGRMRIGAGAGVIVESDIEKEWEELQQKQIAVRGMMGL